MQCQGPDAALGVDGACIFFFSHHSSRHEACLQLLAMIGEQFHPYGSHICGAVLAKRAKGDKISLWTSDFTDKEAVMSIGCVHALFYINF